MIKLVSRRIEISRDFRAPCQSVWALITDTSRWAEWGPSVRSVECKERYIRENSEGRVRTALGLWVPFRITGFEEGRYWTWQVSGIPATGHRLERLDDDLCRLVFEVPLLAAPYSAVCEIALHRISDILEG